MKLDLRERCRRCRKIPRGKAQIAEFERYRPYCSFHCQEWHKLEPTEYSARRRRNRVAPVDTAYDGLPQPYEYSAPHGNDVGDRKPCPRCGAPEIDQAGGCRDQDCPAMWGEE